MAAGASVGSQASEGLPTKTAEEAHPSPCGATKNRAPLTSSLRWARHLLSGDDAWRVEQLDLRVNPHPAKAPRHPRPVLRLGLFLTHQPVDQRRLAHVWVAENSGAHRPGINPAPPPPFVDVPEAMARPYMSTFAAGARDPALTKS
eukprot:scaffold12184_cov114-Isochrysis_galbana.AAC.12